MTPRRRIIVVPVISNSRDEILLCKMPSDRGVFPGLWGLPGGGIEEGETMLQALDREVWEELGMTVSNVTPISFRDDVREKRYPDGRREQLYLIYLLFACRADRDTPTLNHEFEAFAWARTDQLRSFDLNPATLETMRDMGFLES
ncbi:MAG: nucleoside triphosphatase NudI [Acidobacteriota bacterium]